MNPIAIACIALVVIMIVSQAVAIWAALTGKLVGWNELKAMKEFKGYQFDLNAWEDFFVTLDVRELLLSKLDMPADTIPAGWRIVAAIDPPTVPEVIPLDIQTMHFKYDK